MVFTTSEDSKSPTVFVLEMAALLLIPPVTMGLGLAAVSGAENFLPGSGLGFIIGGRGSKTQN